MFGFFYFGADFEINELRDILNHIFENSEVMEEDHKLIVSCNGFTLSFSTGDPGIMFAAEDYDIDLKFCCYIDIIPSYFNWANELITFTGEILKETEGDCILELNDKQILLRKNSVITVDDKKLSGTLEFPFMKLGLDFRYGDID